MSAPQTPQGLEFWKERNGEPPRELVFDSRLTTHANLGRINGMGIDFLTLRRRSASLLKAIADVPEDDWKQVRLNNVGRICRTPKVLDRCVSISGYPGDIRQLAVRDLGHDRPTLLLTNQMRTSAGQFVDRYARRMVIENAIADAIDFFHMDALSAAVPMKIDLHLQLTLMAGGIHRLLAVRIGNGKQTAKSRCSGTSSRHRRTSRSRTTASMSGSGGGRTTRSCPMRATTKPTSRCRGSRTAGCGSASCERGRRDSHQLRPLGIEARTDKHREGVLRMHRRPRQGPQGFACRQLDGGTDHVHIQ